VKEGLSTIGPIAAQQPDVIVGSSTPVTAALQQATRTIPIVFAGISDPVGVGFIASLSRPVPQSILLRADEVIE
jgi:ABC-type uncharacterized transport system substrate-binding protein